MMKKLLILIALFAMCSSANALIFEDNFDHAWTADWGFIDYRGWDASGGAAYSIGGWDGFQSLADPASGQKATLLAYNFVDTLNPDNVGMYQAPYPGAEHAWSPENTLGERNGVLRIATVNGAWADTGNTGAFLYKNVTGDFVSEVQVVARDYWWHACAGLMARAANPNGAGANENWVYLSHFPNWNVGNHIRTTVNGASTEMFIKGYPAEPFLRLTRTGSKFFFEVSADGMAWASLPGAEAGLDRPDLPSELQVGIWAATYGDLTSTWDFENFAITIPEPATISLLGLGGLFLIRRRK
jgi:regulation of enolase protein 1 (concanavalin A-like superfamily)